MIALANRRKHKYVESAIAAMEDARADYQATKKGRFNRRRSNLPSMGGSADYHIRSEYEYYNLIEDCYDLERNDAVVGQLIDRRTANVIQDGFRLEPNTGDKSLDRDLKAWWHAWADDPDECDVAGEACFKDIEYAADWTHILAGDCGISVTHDGPLQFFEPYLIRRDRGGGRGETFLGVDKASDGFRERYWVAETNVNDPYDQTFDTFFPIPVRDEFGLRQFFHVYNQKRMTLTRGVTAFAPIFELTGMLEDVNFAKLVQQQIVSCIAFLIEESTQASGLPSTSTPNYGGQDTRLADTGNNRAYDEVSPGMEVNPGPGKKVTGFSPQVPNPEYFEQYKLILQLICGNLDLPLSIGMLDGSQTNFHGFIGAGNEAKKLWKRSQNRLIRRFHRPCYHAKLQHFIREERAFRKALARLGPAAFSSHTWHPPVWQSVKPLDDTNDRLMRLRNAIVSPSRMQAELNVDYEEHVAETIRDNSFAIRAAKSEALKINNEIQDGQPVHWQQLFPMPTPDGIQATTEIVQEESEVASVA